MFWNKNHSKYYVKIVGKCVVNCIENLKKKKRLEVMIITSN